MRLPRTYRLIIALGAALVASGCAGYLAARRHTGDSAPEDLSVASGASHADQDGSAPVRPSGDCDDEGALAGAADGGDPEHALDDGFEAPPHDPASGAAAAALLSELTDEEIAERLRGDIEALGSMSIGQAQRGALVAGVQMPDGPNWQRINPNQSWGTKETVDALAHAIDSVAVRFPETPKTFIGDISAKRGGHLSPHVSHQAGRDVDVSYYLTAGHRWYATANGSNLDRPRTWYFIRTLLADSDVDLILVDLRIQRLLKEYAREIGEDPEWLDQIFQVGGKSKRPIIFHAKGHATHLHLRFLSPMAQELGRRAYPSLLARRLVSPPTRYVMHKAKAGETLTHLARRYKVSSEVIKKANALTKETLRASKAYRIPQGASVPVFEPLVIPPRNVPPSPLEVAATSGPSEPCRRMSQR